MAGIPNISGEYYQNNYSAGGFAGVRNANTGQYQDFVHGAFYQYDVPKGVGKYSQPLGDTTAGLAFDASRSNPIYGSSTTVTPLSLQVVFIIKYI